MTGSCTNMRSSARKTGGVGSEEGEGEVIVQGMPSQPERFSLKITSLENEYSHVNP